MTMQLPQRRIVVVMTDDRREREYQARADALAKCAAKSAYNQATAKFKAKRSGGKQTAYQCAICNDWHLTSYQDFQREWLGRRH